MSAHSNRLEGSSGLPPCCETDSEETAAEAQSRYSSSRLSRDSVHDQQSGRNRVNQNQKQPALPRPQLEPLKLFELVTRWAESLRFLRAFA